MYRLFMIYFQSLTFEQKTEYLAQIYSGSSSYSPAAF